MTEIVIGATTDEGSRDAAALGIALARTLDAVPVVVHVRPEPWRAAGSGRVDAEWDAYLEQSSRETVEAVLRADAADFEELGAVPDIGQHRQSGTGLDELAQRRGSSVIVIGSARGGTPGRVQGGSTSEQLLHGSHVPVAIAPTGYAGSAPGRIERVVVAIDMDYRPGRLTAALDLLPDVEVELVCVVRRATAIYTTQLGVDAELEVLHVLRARAADALTAAQAEIRRTTQTRVLVGDTVDAALAEMIWHHGDLLVCGSSTLGPVRRVLLGDMTFRLLRAATVPVLVAPRPG
jgi:nucleotide-binding universal stress UspA family protein